MSPSNTRWCPTPEHRMILEELYRRGLRSPNAIQIQRITGHLSMYGSIQGKNVFYWFQNHKARERQKLRKKLANDVVRYFHAQGGINGVGPTSASARDRERPLQTLQLFPLTATVTKGGQNSTSS